jgi:FG-GAP-like repeat
MKSGALTRGRARCARASGTGPSRRFKGGMSARRTVFAYGAVLAAASAVVASAVGSPGLRLSPAGRYFTPGDYTYSLASGDLNRDGRSDVVAGDVNSEGGWDKTTLLLSRGRRLSPARDLHFSGSSDVALVDLNGDRNLDVVRIGLLPGRSGPHEYEWRGAVLLGNGHGRFPRRRSFVVPANTDGGDYLRAMAAGDFDRDGRRDLAVVESGVDDPGVWVLIGEGGGGFSEMRRYRTAESPQDLVVADFNRDRNPDLAVVRLGVAVAAPW